MSYPDVIFYIFTSLLELVATNIYFCDSLILRAMLVIDFIDSVDSEQLEHPSFLTLDVLIKFWNLLCKF